MSGSSAKAAADSAPERQLRQQCRTEQGSLHSILSMCGADTAGIIFRAAAGNQKSVDFLKLLCSTQRKRLGVSLLKNSAVLL